MGQQIALQEKVEHIQDQIITTSRSQTVNNDNQYVPKQGILKISINPFPYASLIGSTINGLPIYAQKSKSLQQQSKERKKQMNFLSQDQILDLIQSTVYTLASYEQESIIYKDISSKHIFLTKIHKKNSNSSKMQFKLLPNPLIQETTYERLYKIKKDTQSGKSHSYNFSPQMIIAFRAREKQFNDVAFLKKSNVFTLGMVFLEIATLQFSSKFYDQKTFDIFQQTIEQSLSQVEGRYGSTIVKIIANMIDFDFQERIEGFIELAKWIIIELEDIKYQETKDEINIQTFQNDKFAPTVQLSPNNITYDSFDKNLKSETIQEQVQMMPVCHKKNQKSQKIFNTKSRLEIRQFQKDKQNKSSQNQIKITVKEVPVYLQKNSRVKYQKQNKARIMYSPFTNAIKSSDFSSYERAKCDLMGQTKRSLAFQETNRLPRNLLKQFSCQSKPLRSQR